MCLLHAWRDYFCIHTIVKGTRLLKYIYIRNKEIPYYIFTPQILKEILRTALLHRTVYAGKADTATLC